MRILIVYLAPHYPIRYAIADHLYSFRRHSNHHCFYFNALRPKVPSYLRKMQWDAVIFHNTFLIRRATFVTRPRADNFAALCEKLAFLKTAPCPKIAIAQDENNHTDALCAFIRDFNVCLVSTECPTDKEMDIAYKGHIPPEVRLVKHLPGYVEPRRISQLQRLWDCNRDIDIGYRSFTAKARLGRLGILKWKIADEVEKHAGAFGLRTDISTDHRKTMHGSDWIYFLARCRYTLGVEGGSSVIDRDGSIFKYEHAHPDATFAEIEAKCFPGQDGNFNYAIMTPRTFEAAMTKTCLILVEGEYNGILKPDVHYIPIKKDFSNIEEVLASLSDESRRRRIIENVWRDLVASEKYLYKSFVDDCLSPLAHAPDSGNCRQKVMGIVWYYVNVVDNIREQIAFFINKHLQLLKKRLAKKFLRNK